LAGAFLVYVSAFLVYALRLVHLYTEEAPSPAPHRNRYPDPLYPIVPQHCVIRICRRGSSMDLTVESDTIVRCGCGSLTGTTLHVEILTLDITGWREGSMSPTAFTHACALHLSCLALTDHGVPSLRIPYIEYFKKYTLAVRKEYNGCSLSET
jgi:hypothetical protein